MPKALKRETKNKNKRIASTSKVFLTLFLIFGVVAISRSPLNIFAATSLEDLRTQQQEQAKRLNELNNQVKNYQNQIVQFNKQANTLQNQIAIYNAQINQAEAQISASQTRIDIATSEIKSLSGQIDDKQSSIDQNKIQLAEMIRQLYEMDASSSTIIALMNNDNLSDFIDAVSQIKSLQGKSYELLQTIKTLKVELEDNRAEVQKQKDALVSYQQDLEDQQKVLNNQKSQKNQLLAQTRGQESAYQKLLATSQAEQDEIQEEIDRLEKEIRSKLGQLDTPVGKFVWPIAGAVLTQGYGNTGFRSLGYSFHNGYDIAGPPGSPIVAVADGEVHAIGYADPTNTKAYGNWVVTKHTLKDGRQVMVLSAHMMRISVSVGQKLKAGQVIGTEGNTGNTTRLLRGQRAGYHIHLTVFDSKGFQIVKHPTYQIPVGYTYNPGEFFK